MYSFVHQSSEINTNANSCRTHYEREALGTPGMELACETGNLLTDCRVTLI